MISDMVGRWLFGTLVFKRFKLSVVLWRIGNDISVRFAAFVLYRIDKLAGSAITVLKHGDATITIDVESYRVGYITT